MRSWAALASTVSVAELPRGELSLAAPREPRWSRAFLGLLVLFVLRQEVTPLDHPTRRRIHDHLLRLPGDHFRSIVRTLGLSQGTAWYHLGILVDRGIVGVRKVDGRVRYFVRGASPDAERTEVFLKHWAYRDLRGRVFRVVQEHPQLRSAEVAERLGISRQLAEYHLTRLRETGLLQGDVALHRK